MSDHIHNAHRGILLAEDNYEVWRIQTQAILVAADLWDVVRPAIEVLDFPKGAKGARELQRKRDQARSKLVLSVSQSQLPFIMGSEDPRENWEALQEVHRSSSVNSALSLRRSFLRMFKLESETILTWIGRVRARALELSHSPCPAKDIDIILVMTEGLPLDYRSVVTQLDNIPIEQLTISLVTSRIIGFEAQLNRELAKSSEVIKLDDNSSITAYVARGDVICRRCAGHGHYERECPSPKSYPKAGSVMQAHLAKVEEPAESTDHVARFAHMSSDDLTIRMF
jgi:hypothetical protein